MDQINRRDFLKLSAVTGAGAFIAACSAGATAAPSAGGSAAPSSFPSPSAPTSQTPGSINFLTWSDHWGKDELAAVKSMASTS
jgi:hypothetical protein